MNVVRGEICTFFLQRKQGPYTVGQNDVFGIQLLDMNTEYGYCLNEHKRHTPMKFYDWNDEKNELLKESRGISFEQVVLAIDTGDLIDRIRHQNPGKYPNQKVFLVKIEEYIYSVPYVEDDEKIFLKTIIPNSKATKKYIGGIR